MNGNHNNASTDGNVMTAYEALENHYYKCIYRIAKKFGYAFNFAYYTKKENSTIAMMIQIKRGTYGSSIAFSHEELRILDVAHVERKIFDFVHYFQLYIDKTETFLNE